MFKRFCAIFCLIINTYGSDMEPKCYSRFDYDEKMLLKLQKIEDQIKKFEDHLKEMKETLNAETSNRMESFANEMGEFRERNLEEVQRQQNLTEQFNESLNRTETTLNESLQHHESLIKEIIDNANEKMETYDKFVKDVVFTVTGPDDGRTSGSLKFKNIITNEGDGYDISTGIFTCPIRGLYYFSLHLMKRYGSSQDQVGCYIKMNGAETVRAHFNPDDYDSTDEYGSYGVSTSVYVRLEEGSLVTVAGCYFGYRGASSSMESWSSFSGHLIRP